MVYFRNLITNVLIMSLKSYLFGVLTLMFTQELFSQIRVIDYYRLLSSYDDDIKHHTVFMEKGHWFSKTKDASKVKVFIDNASRFMEIRDKEIGGAFIMQVSIFEDIDGEVYLGLVKNHYDVFLHGEIHILKQRNGRWNDVTKEVMPQLSYADFFKDEYKSDNSSIQHHLEFGFQLPVSGQDAKAIMDTQNLTERCAQKDETVKDFCTELDLVSFSMISLKWIPERAVFEIGDKFQ